MDLVYHALATYKAVGARFGDLALEQVIKANQAQDSLLNQLRGDLHFDNQIAQGRAYVKAERANVVRLAAEGGSGEPARAAFGRLCHAVQDFYAHTNYVRLWLACNGGLDATLPGDVDALDASLLDHPDLRTGSFFLWRDWVYYVPVVKRLARRIRVLPGSHEAMNLDSPTKGPEFAYAFAAACQRTEHEYQLVVQAIGEAGGDGALDMFRRARF
jgi:hypothetical protein